VATLTNDTYAKSLAYKKTTSMEQARGARSLDRFVRAAQKTADFDKKPMSETEAVNYAFEILSNVAQPHSTQWSIVYDQKSGKIHFRTLQTSQIKTIDAKAFDYSCGSNVKIYDMNANEAGDITGKFKDYSHRANRDLIERAFNGTNFLTMVPPPFRDQLASYPEQFGCSAQQSQPSRAAASSPNSFFLIVQILFNTLV
jgi:hypothetical protein